MSELQLANEIGEVSRNNSKSESTGNEGRIKSAKTIKKSGGGWKSRLFPIGLGLLFILIWQYKIIHKIFNLQEYQLPVPSAILQAIEENGHTLVLYGYYTSIEIVGGFLAGSALGWIAAYLAVTFPWFGKGGVAIAASLNAVPIVALAPIMNNWLGSGELSRIGVVTVLTTATMTVNGFKGMNSIGQSYLELFSSYSATSKQVFMKLRFQNSLPYVFSALKINMTTSIIGAIVGEFFVSSRGLGYWLSDQIKLANMPVAWSCIVIAAVIGIMFYYIIELIEKVTVPWKESRY